MPHYYPALLQLDGKPCLVIGGGTVAERKVHGLLDCGAVVTVVAPDLTEGLQRLVSVGQIGWLPRGYQEGDLNGAFLTIAATDDPLINSAAWEEAGRACSLINVVDDPAHCTFLVPSTLRRGDLTVSVSTGGHSPALAARIRRELEAQFSPSFARLLELLAEWRASVGTSGTAQQRRRLWEALVQEDLLSLLEAGCEDLARERFAALRQAIVEPARAAET